MFKIIAFKREEMRLARLEKRMLKLSEHDFITAVKMSMDVTSIIVDKADLEEIKKKNEQIEGFLTACGV